MSTLQPAVTLAVPECRCVRISPDGTALLTLGAELVQVRHLMSGRRGWSRTWDALAELPVEAVWGAGGEAVTLLTDGRLSLLDGLTGADRPVPGELADRQNATAVALSRNGLVLAIGTQEGAIFLWQQDTGRVEMLRGGGDPVTALAWRPDGQELCVARPRSIQFWQLRSGTMISSLDAGDIYPRRQ